MSSPEPVVVIGAGPAGLTAAYELGKAGVPPVVLEGTDVVGGISRTVERDGWRFDIGGHRFFTKVPEVEALWHEILPDEEFLLRPRMSRIYYRGKFYDYPLKASNALGNLGVIEAARCIGSYAWSRVRPPKSQDTLEDWIVARFGKLARLDDAARAAVRTEVAGIVRRGEALRKVSLDNGDGPFPVFHPYRAPLD